MKGNNYMNRGFTLVELLMMLTLTAIMTAVAVPAFMNLGNDARTAVTKAKLVEIRQAIIGTNQNTLGFKLNMGRYPTSLDELETQGVLPHYNPISKTGWDGPYIGSSAGWDKDAWGVSFVYDDVGRTIKSCGPNGTCGNDDDIIVSF